MSLKKIKNEFMENFSYIFCKFLKEGYNYKKESSDISVT